ncbi:MAG: CPBP family intramembrane metalloprotease [Clostridia bacterium]|nr:CPBP family intramembrane metalloprotease [Clostridia bacterium]
MKSKNLFKINLIYFITMVAFVGLRILSSVGIFNGLSSSVASTIFSIVIQVGVMFILPISLMLIIFKKGVKKTFSDLGFKKISFNSILIALAIGVLAFFLNIIVSTVFNGIISFFGYNPANSGSGATYDTFLKFLQALILVAVLPGIFEEIVHRGILLKGYTKEIGVKRALIYSSILFGLMHLNVGQVFYATIMGLLIGITVIVSGSIFPAMIVHFVNNAINIYLVYAAHNQLVGYNFYDSINSFLQGSNPAFIFIMSFVFLALLILFIVILFLQLFKESTVGKLENIKNKVEKTLDSEIFGTDQPLEVTEVAAVNTILVEKLRPLLPDFSKIKSPVDILIPESEEDKYIPSTLENMFFYASVFLGVAITIFTFIWGVV